MRAVRALANRKLELVKRKLNELARLGSVLPILWSRAVATAIPRRQIHDVLGRQTDT